MISMLFPTVIDNVIKQLPQLDLTFGIGDFVGSIALLVSAFAFYISPTQASQSEQIKTSRDIWAGIVEKYSKYMEARREHSKGKGGPDENELERKARNNFRGWLAVVDYFAYLILEGEVKDKVVIGYYRGLLAYNIYLMRNLSEKTDREFSSAPYFDKLTRKWRIRVPPLSNWGDMDR